MPINTFTCSQCGARNNYIVDLSDDGHQLVECVRCGNTDDIEYSELPERVKETITELNDFNRKFSSDMSYFEQSSTKNEDTVETAIQEVDNAFTKAKQELQAFDDELHIDTNIQNIAEQYAPREDEMTGFMKSVRSAKKAAMNDNGDLRTDWKQSVAKEAVKSYSKTKLSNKWDASDEEIESLFAVVEQIANESQQSGMNIKDLIRRNPKALVKIIKSNVDANFARQLIGMIDNGNFLDLLADATDDYQSFV